MRISRFSTKRKCIMTAICQNIGEYGKNNRVGIFKNSLQDARWRYTRLLRRTRLPRPDTHVGQSPRLAPRSPDRRRARFLPRRCHLRFRPAARFRLLANRLVENARSPQRIQIPPPAAHRLLPHAIQPDVDGLEHDKAVRKARTSRQRTRSI